MPVSPETINGHTAAAFMAVTPNVMGNMWAIFNFTYVNTSYLIPLRDAVIAAGKAPNDPMVTKLNNAHYLSSDATERCGTMAWVKEMQAAATDVEAATAWLEAEPEPEPPPPEPEAP